MLIVLPNFVQAAPRLISRIKAFVSSESRSFQWYRTKFSVKGTGSRKSLFHELEECTAKLEKLLKVSDRNKQLFSKRSSSSLTTATEQALFRFWKHADNFFHALAASRNCRCTTHIANLLLQHRTSGHPDFEVLLTRYMELDPSNSWKVRNAKFVAVEQERNNSGQENANMFGGAPIHAPPSHRDSRPAKSAMGGSKAGGTSKGKTAMFVGIK